MTCFSKWQEVRGAVIIRKETLILGDGLLSAKDPLVLMHPVLIKKSPTTLQTPRALDSEEGSLFASAGWQKGLVSHLPKGIADCWREQLACRWWGGERLGRAAAVTVTRSAVTRLRK